MSRFYQNPMRIPEQWGGNQLGDPYIMRSNGYSYLYCSSQRGPGIKCWRSEDLTDWEYRGLVCELPEVTGAYAPEVLYLAGRYYMVTSPVGSGHYLLSSDSPEGPFALETGNFGLLIDGSLFVDDDGREYLLRAGHKGIVIHDMPQPNRPEIRGKTLDTAYLEHWTEGPMIIKRGGYYFLTYTGNHLLSRGYRVCYSVSPEAPDSGYVNMENRTLLLETGDEFHALGHSSSVPGPDMDSWYIAYHSFDFTPEKPFRSLNLDRLFFNGARMYTNACWWPQPNPALPWFTSRGGENLNVTASRGLTKYETPVVSAPFTMELCFVPEPEGVIVDLGDALTLRLAETLTLCDAGGAALLSAKLPEIVSLSAPVELRLSVNEQDLQLWVNTLSIGTVRVADLLGGSFRVALHLPEGRTPGYIGISNNVSGQGDRTAPKSIPGRFDAVHGTSHKNADETPCREKGLTIYCLNCGVHTRLSYTLNVKAAGVYTVWARVRYHERLGFHMNNTQMSLPSEVMRDGEDFALVRCGTLFLDQGMQELILSDFTSELTLDYLSLALYEPVTALTVIEDGDRVCDRLAVCGHKRELSMLPKTYGYTCAENHGMAFVGEDGWLDYHVSATLRVCHPSCGSASLFLRVTKESWYPAQVASSLVGYRLQLDGEGLRLFRCDYDQTPLLSLALPPAEEIRLSVKLRRNRMDIKANGYVLSYEDPHPVTHGKIGLEARGEGYGFTSLTVEPGDDN